MQGLRELRVIDASDRIAGAYATKLLADAWAEVVKLEPPDGDALRRWTASDQSLGDADGALFQFLNTSKQSIVGQLAEPSVDALLRGADLFVETSTPESPEGQIDRARPRRALPRPRRAVDLRLRTGRPPIGTALCRPLRPGQ